jgi:hypothetical protein
MVDKKVLDAADKDSLRTAVGLGKDANTGQIIEKMIFGDVIPLPAETKESDFARIKHIADRLKEKGKLNASLDIAKIDAADKDSLRTAVGLGKDANTGQIIEKMLFGDVIPLPAGTNESDFARAKHIAERMPK